jgi:hypothetical protein
MNCFDSAQRDLILRLRQDYLPPIQIEIQKHEACILNYQEPLATLVLLLHRPFPETKFRTMSTMSNRNLLLLFIAADDNFFLLQLERLTQKHYHYRLSQYTGVANAQFKFHKQKEILHRPSLA